MVVRKSDSGQHTYFPPSLLTSFNRRDIAAGIFRIVTILWVKFHSDATYAAVNGEIWAMAEAGVVSDGTVKKENSVLLM